MGDDPCCWLDGFPRPSTVAIRGVHTSFMSEAELIQQLCEVKEKGFDESFSHFCAKTYSSYKYPPENHIPGIMHAHYLRLALELLTDAEGRKELFHGTSEGDKMDAAFQQVTRESYRAVLESDRSFCEIFVENWCHHWAV